MNNVSLVVLAAGMGNRFGGLKQLTGVGPNGETLLEYGVYDAFQSGVRKVIFIVRRSFETEFRQVVVNRFADYMEVECVYQEINDLPSSFSHLRKGSVLGVQVMHYFLRVMLWMGLS